MIFLKQCKSVKVYQHSTMSPYNKPNSTIKPYCKVCHDTGKPESVYRSHYVKSAPGANGVIVCPTLASLECKYCHQKGHTVKHCTVLADRKKQEEKEAKRKEREQKIQEAPKIEKTNLCVKNIYSCLEDDEDYPDVDDLPDLVPILSKTDDLPPLVPLESYAPVKSYAAALASQPPPPAPAPALPAQFEVIAKPSPIKEAPVIKPIPTFDRLRMTNWADWSDSDEEDLK
jgi:hypothetical protein